MVAEALREAFDGAPIELEAHGHYEHVVTECFPCLRDHSLGFGLESSRSVLDPDGARRDHSGLRAVGCFVGEQAGAGQDPARLVLVNGSGLQDCHIQAGTSS
jgi:hypothetical protein